MVLMVKVPLFSVVIAALLVGRPLQGEVILLLLLLG